MTNSVGPPPHRLAFGTSFFTFGLVNNVLYVVILSAALDLLSTVGGEGSTPPKGLILAANIAPAFAVKVLGPYIHGSVNYRGRIVFCSALSFVGILIVASSNSLAMRLFGIALASFSSGLGEMTYLQLSTVYGSLSLPYDLGGIAVGWFASGTGAAGLVGAGLWWLLRGLGVREGLLICSVLPLGMASVFFGLLPKTDAFAGFAPDAYDIVRDLSSEDEDDDPLADERRAPPQPVREPVHLTIREKLQLVKPLLLRFCLPLFTVYWAEYTINQGVAPTLLYEIPKPSQHPVLASLFKQLPDYYVTYQLVYQAFVFVSRSSLSIFHLPPLPLPLLPVPTLVQLCLLAITALESSTGVISRSLGEAATTWIVMLLIGLEGLCGGAAYVNAFYHLGQEMDDEGELSDAKDSQRRGQEREVRIASVGAFDTLGILLASGTASLLEPRLCGDQLARGKMLCKGM